MHNIEELNNENNGCSACGCVNSIVDNSKATYDFDILEVIRSNFIIAVSLVTNDEHVRWRVDKLIEAMNTIDEEYKDSVKQFVSVVSKNRKLFECKAKAIFGGQYREDLWDEIRENISLGTIGDMIEGALQIAKFRPIMEAEDINKIMAGALGFKTRIWQIEDKNDDVFFMELKCREYKLVLPLGV
jgi:hypothetical protein